MNEAVVKIDAKLLADIDKFISFNKYEFSSKKQVVNLAIIEFLKLKGFNINNTKRGKNE